MVVLIVAIAVTTTVLQLVAEASDEKSEVLGGYNTDYNNKTLVLH